MKNFFRLLRAKQWVKNTFLFFPLLFSGSVFEDGLFGKTLIVFGGFCLVASSLYVFNDLIDLEKDRVHPKKSQRPLVKYKINTGLIVGLILVMLGVGLFIIQRVDVDCLWPVLLYVVLNLIYNFYAKSIVILDVMFVAFGFHIRIWTGSLAANAPPSAWLQLCVFLLALFLGFTKRRAEFNFLKEKAAEHRQVLSHYTLYLLDQIIIICSTLAIVFYGLYTISPDVVARLESYKMVYSLVFVIYGIFRYLYLVHVKRLGEEPSEILLKDKPLLINIVLWILYVGILIYR